MLSIKKTTAVLLAALQLSWSFGATDALAQNVVQSARVTGGNSVGVPAVGPLNYSQPSSLSGNSVIGGSRLVPMGSLPSLYSPAPDIAIPGTLSPEAVVFSMAQSGGVVAEAPGSARIQTFAAPAPSRLAAPTETRGATEAKGAASVEAASTKVGDAIKALDLSEQAPAESSKDSADGIFAALVGEKLISPTAAVEARGPSATPATLSASRSVFRRGLAFFRGSPSASQQTVKPEVPAPAGEAQAPAKTSIWRHPSARRAAVLAGTVALAVAAPFLTAHVGWVAAAGSITLSVLGIPQIISNFKSGREGVRDLTIASPLMWFAAASLLSLVSIGNGSSVWWNAANLAGVLESALVVGQLNYYKKDSKALKATIATAAAVALPIALIASQAVAPLAAGLNAAFTAAMAILWVLDAPQIRQNYRIFTEQGRAPQGISPAYKLLLIAGSLMHLFAALMGGDLRWALNAAIAITMGSTVLAQMYAPRAANAVLGPLVRAAEALGRLVRREPPAAAGRDLAEARTLVDKEFQGVDYLRFQSRDAAQTLASIQENAAALPGRSVILLEAPTAAGKSTLAEVMSKTLKGRIVVFPVDRYFRSFAEIPQDPQGRPDYDRPEALHLKRAADDVKTLLAGGRVELPKHVMDGPTTFDSGEFLRLGPEDVLIVDSIFASHRFFLEATQGRQVLNVYLAAPAAARLARRLKRDKTERGITVENNLKGWTHLLANERSNILPLREKADVVVNLMTPAELERLPQALAELLAQEWAANGRDAAKTELFLSMIRASVQADHTPGPLPEGDPERLMRQVDVSGDVPAPERLRTLAAKALETYTAVQKAAAELPNFSDFHVHAAVELSDGRWASAPNMELSREITLCAERAAILAALAGAPAGTKVKTIVVSNSGGEFKKLCAECLSWLATGKFFSPDTEIVSVARDPASGRVSIRIRTLKSILPYHLGAARQPSLTDKPVGSLEVSLSRAAQRAGASAVQARSLMTQARRAYDRGAAEELSAKPAAAAVKLSPFGRAGAVRFQWAARFSEYEDVEAATAALERSARRRGLLGRVLRLADKASFGLFQLERRQEGLLKPPSIAAVAYYGSDANLPPIASIARLTRKGAGSDTVILRIEDGRIQARTLGEYMTEIYDRR